MFINASYFEEAADTKWEALEVWAEFRKDVIGWFEYFGRDLKKHNDSTQSKQPEAFWKKLIFKV